MATKTTKKSAESTGLYTAGFVLGIIGVVFAFIPLCYWIAYILGGLALIFGIIGLVKKAEGYKALTATILGAVALIAGIVMNIRTVQTVNEIGNEIINSFSETLENYDSDIVGKYADVTIEGWQEVNTGWSDHAVVVKVKNISDKTRSFALYIEALDENGDRIDDSYVSANELAPGQTQTVTAFELTKLTDEQMKNATFNIYQSSTY